MSLSAKARPALPALFMGLVHWIYGLYAAGIFALLGVIAFLLVSLPLSLMARRHIAHFAGRGFFFLAGMPLRLLDAHRLPDRPCVVVANHASYLDGIVLKAALPARFSFVIKKEVSRVPIAGLLLRRIGSAFVDRFNRHAGAMDARRLFKAADAGQALVFFSEGTIQARPGLRKFQTGAFAIALHAGLPIVPVAIRGTRQTLPSGRFLPRPARIEVQILPPLISGDGNPAAAISVARDEARARILAVLDEPDLGDDDGLAALHERRS